MKKITAVSAVAALLLLTGCGDKSKEPSETQIKEVVETAKEEITKPLTQGMENLELAKENAAKAVENTKETAAKAAEIVKDAANEISGAALYTKCVVCHGADGKTKAMGKSEIIAGQAKDVLAAKIKEYKAGTRNTAQMGALMQGQVAALSDVDIEKVAAHIAALK